MLLVGSADNDFIGDVAGFGANREGDACRSAYVTGSFEVAIGNRFGQFTEFFRCRRVNHGTITVVANGILRSNEEQGN